MVDYLYHPVAEQDLPKDLHDSRPGIWWHAAFCGGGRTIMLERYDLVRETPKGVWVELHKYHLPPIWRHKGSRWLHSTKAGALHQLHARKVAHVKHARRRLADAERGLEAIKRAVGFINRQGD